MPRRLGHNVNTRKFTERLAQKVTLPEKHYDDANSLTKEQKVVVVEVFLCVFFTIARVNTK